MEFNHSYKIQQHLDSYLTECLRTVATQADTKTITASDFISVNLFPHMVNPHHRAVMRTCKIRYKKITAWCVGFSARLFICGGVEVGVVTAAAAVVALVTSSPLSSLLFSLVHCSGCCLIDIPA